MLWPLEWALGIHAHWLRTSRASWFGSLWQEWHLMLNHEVQQAARAKCDCIYVPAIPGMTCGLSSCFLLPSEKPENPGFTGSTGRKRNGSCRTFVKERAAGAAVKFGLTAAQNWEIHEYMFASGNARSLPLAAMCPKRHHLTLLPSKDQIPSRYKSPTPHFSLHQSR